MGIKKILLLLGIILFISCSENNEVLKPNSLKEYIAVNDAKMIDEVIACAASKNNDTDISFIFYYPIEGATNIQYFETEDANVNKEDFELYTLVDLEKEAVFNGYLERFIRNGETTPWCIVTYETEGKIHVSNPIKLKSTTKPTEWTDAVIINEELSLMPHFLWEDGTIKENEIYFQVISDENNDLLTATYTYDTWFQFYDLNNVVLNITTNQNPILSSEEIYNFTMMGVSEDNWVNLVIQKSFIAK